MFCLKKLVIVTVVCFLCFKTFDSLCLVQIVQICYIKHSGNIRLPNLKYQQRMMNIAQAGGKNIDVITRDIVIDKG